jgi:hypothetical protein
MYVLECFIVNEQQEMLILICGNDGMQYFEEFDPRIVGGGASRYRISDFLAENILIDEFI